MVTLQLSCRICLVVVVTDAFCRFFLSLSVSMSKSDTAKLSACPCKICGTRGLVTQGLSAFETAKLTINMLASQEHANSSQLQQKLLSFLPIVDPPRQSVLMTVHKFIH